MQDWAITGIVKQGMKLGAGLDDICSQVKQEIGISVTPFELFEYGYKTPEQRTERATQARYLLNYKLKGAQTNDKR